jgi:hypothetical protein
MAEEAVMAVRSIRMFGAGAAFVLVLAGCGAGGGDGSTPTPGATGLGLDPVPYTMVVPAELLDRLATAPIADEAFLAEATAAGATATVEVTYDPVEGDPIHFMNVYRFSEAAFDATITPDSPPPFGEEIRREDGEVLAVWGPLDMPFAMGSEDAEAWSTLTELIRDPATFVPEA